MWKSDFYRFSLADNKKKKRFCKVLFILTRRKVEIPESGTEKNCKSNLFSLFPVLFPPFICNYGLILDKAGFFFSPML